MLLLASLALEASALNAGTAGGYDWRFFAAGGISAALSHGYTTPIDVVKTRMQTNPELYNGSVPLALQRILADEGVLFLLSGLLPTCVGYGIEGALKFGCYELFKPIFQTNSELGNLILASTVAGAVASVVLCPAEDVRIRAVSGAEPRGLIASFGSLPAMLSKQVPYTMGKQVSFDFLCELVHSAIALFSDRLDSLTPVIAALPAAVLACVLSHPGDTVLTRFFKDDADSVLAAFTRVSQEGRLFAGIKARLLHVIGILWIQLVVYDKVKQFLGLPATGH